MSYVYSAAIYSPGEGKTVKNMEDQTRHWRGEISSGRSNLNFEELRVNDHQMPRFEVQTRVPRANGTPQNSAPSPRHEDDEYKNETLFFERNRIKQLQDERVHIQKKTFTKWCNSFLNRARLEINDLFTDVGDGVLLMKLLEIISGEKLGKPNRGRMRVQKIENLNKVLDFLKMKKIQLENIGAEDILDRNERLILGLIWTIILRFQIDTIVIDADEEPTGERKHAKDALLLWCQRKTAGYANVRVDNFTSSWRSGLAFNALIHAHRPDLVNFDSLHPNDHIGNLNNAFDIAEKRLEIARLLDAEDVDVARPDEKSIITYVSLYYHTFAKQKTELTGAKRVANIVGKLMNSETMEDDYEHISSDLLKWINDTIQILNSRRFPNNLAGMRDEHAKFNHFRTTEKPPKYKEKGELEALFFTIQTKRKAMGRKPYVPPQGLFMHDIESAWERLDRAENERNLAIISELQRQERLEQLAQRFHKKAALREQWLRTQLTVLEEMDHGHTAAEVEKSLKKQQAISTDILAREDRFKLLTTLCNELSNERYHDSDKIRVKEREVSEKWTYLLSLLEQRRRSLMSLNDLMTLLRDLDTLSSELKLLEPPMRNRDVGKHLLGVEDLLGKHELVEAQINTQGKWLDNITRDANEYIRNKGEQHSVLQRKLDDVSTQYNALLDLCRARRLALSKALNLFRFIQDHEEEMSWIEEKQHLCRRALASGDITAVSQTTLLFKSIELEKQAHWNHVKDMITVGESLIQSGQAKEDIQRRLAALNHGWQKLEEALKELGQWLSEARQAQQYFQDANEAESWIREKMPLVKSDDLGRDEGAAKSLLQRHTRLEEEIVAYRADIVRLEEMASQLASSSFHSADDQMPSRSTDSEDIVVPQVEMMYKYEGNGMSVKKGEVLALLEKSTHEWWRVLKQDTTEGYVPANYCRLVPGESVTVTQSATTSTSTDPTDGRKAITERQKVISSDYRQLNRLAEVRRRLLSDNIKLMRFYRECDEFEGWAAETQAALGDEPTVEHVKAFRRKFDKIDSDMKSNGGHQLNRINQMADELRGEGHSQSGQIEARQRRVNALWAELERLRKLRASQLETSERVADFESSCGDAKAWMNEKFDVLDRNPQDLKSLQNLDRDLKPLEDKIKYLEALAAEVKKKDPAAAAIIDKKIAELKALHADLLKRSNQKLQLAEQTQGREMFETALRDVLAWTDRTKRALSETVHPVSVAHAEELMKKHYELGEQLKNKKYEVDYVEELGRRLLDKNPHMKDVNDQLKNLRTQIDDIKNLYRNRDAFLKEKLDLQLFNLEAERIDAATKGHEAFLDFNDLGDSVESVENLLKRHRDLEAKLDAQEARLEGFSKNADSLIGAGHSDSPYIDQRRNEVFARRQNVRKLAADRRRGLEASLEYQNVKRNGEEMIGWINEKKKMAHDDSHRDLATIENKILKHEAFEAEIGANAPRVDQINKAGNNLVAKKHYESANTQKLLKHVNAEWADLQDAVRQRGERLRQAADQKSLNRVLDDAHAKLGEFENALKSGERGADLRAVKDLIQRHAILEQEIGLHENRLMDINAKGQNMAQQGHYDAPRIRNTVDALLKRYHDLSGPVAARRAALEESLKWHQLVFDVDCELQWIAEKVPIASSTDTGRNLTEALNMIKKQDQLEAEIHQHAAHIEQTLAQGANLVKHGHGAAKSISDKCDELTSAWKNLQRLIRGRRQVVDWGVKEQQFMFDAAEVESWMAEKKSALSSNDYGIDEDAAQKLLAKHKALQHDMQAYRQWIKNLDVKCDELVKSGRPNTERFVQKKNDLNAEFDRLSQMAEDRLRALEDAVCLFEYMRESADLEQWINEQLQTAMSEDYGDDYEHLQELRLKFEEFKQSVKTGSERFVSCEAVANSILRRNPPFARDILKKQEKLRSVWTLLLDYIESREQKLAAAEELHKFNRDVGEHEQWVADKIGTMPRDLGRDVKQVQSLYHKHDALDQEISGTEPRLRHLLEESTRLKEAYPGGNAEHIAAQQVALADSWQELKDASADRKDMLKAAYDLHRFNKDVRDLLAWTDVTIVDMQSELHINDLQQAEWLMKEHSRLSNEIDAREPDFGKLIATGRKMIAAQHYAEADLRQRIAQIEEALVRLRSEWALRNSYLSQVVQWHAFQREAKQILATISSKRTTLKSLAVGGSLADVESQKKRLETFAKALSTLDERTAVLDHTAKRLIDEKHMEKANIDSYRRRVLDSLAGLREDIDIRRHLLDDAFALSTFESDVIEMDAWIEEKLKFIRAENERQVQLASVEDKMRLLQKHQALEAELATNKIRVDQIVARGRELAAKHNRPQASQRASELSARWSRLLEASADQSRALEEFRDLLVFRQLVESVLAHIREKELLISAGDMGRDLEHCKLLLAKLDDASNTAVNENTLVEINRLGEKLIHQGRSSREEVQMQQEQLNTAWTSQRSKLDAYRRDLKAAIEVHMFNRDVDDTNDRIYEKIAAMKNDDYGKDFASVDALLRKQTALERDMSVIHQKLIQHDSEAQKILNKKPPLRHTIVDSLKKLEESWKLLSDAAEQRNDKLDKSYKLHKYLDQVKKTELWASQLRNKMTSHATPKTSADARRLIEQHAERKAEIDARQEELRVLHDEGQRLITEQPEHKSDVQRAHKRVHNAEHQLRQTWESEKAQLQRTLEWLLWCDQATQTEQWLTDKENFLKQADLGHTPDAVQMLIKSHEAFDEAVKKQSDRVAQLSKDASQLIESGNEFRGDVEARCAEIVARHETLLKQVAHRRVMLEESKRYHEFIRACSELITWITAKLQLAYDESYLDPTNLRAKLQKHLAFDSELTENEKRLRTVEAQGEDLIRGHHFMSEQVTAQLVELRSGWDELRSKSSLKAQRLREAYEAHTLQRKIEDTERWLDRIETDLTSEDHGRDLLSVEQLMKKLEALDAEIQGRSDAVRDVVVKARELKTRGSTNSEAILALAEQVDQRYQSLGEPVAIRRDNLRDALRLFVWCAASEEVLEWINDKLPLAKSQDYGDNLTAAVNLQKKHTALEKELESRQTQIHEIESRGMDMVRQKHFAGRQIEHTIDQLASSLLTIKDAAALRRDRLQHSVDSHTFYSEAAEVEQWIKDQLPLATSQETGRDQLAAESHLRRLGVLDKEVLQMRVEVDKLAHSANAILTTHPESTQIVARLRKVEAAYEDLIHESQRRRAQLVDAGKYHRFVRQVDDLSDWLRDKDRAAASEDYGRDLEDCVYLMEKFDTVLRELSAAGERVAAVQRTQEELLRTGHPNTASIQAKGADLQRLWTSVNDTANERQQALAGARKVHRFDQEADETLNWLGDKEAMGVAMEQEEFTHADLAQVKAQIQRHDEFVHGLKAVEKQVSELCREAEQLWTAYPNTRQHLEVRRLDMEEQLKDILQGAHRHYERLVQMQNLQAYFQEYRELMVWIKRMKTVITSESLPRDVQGCLALARRHDEYNVEMQGRKPHVDDFVRQGRQMTQHGHVLSQEINEKVRDLDESWGVLCEVWKERNELYVENLDCQQWKQNASELEDWLLDREKLLGDDWRHVDSVDSAERLIRDFDDFLVTLDAQSERYDMVKRLTLVEQNFTRLRKKEIERDRTADENQKRRETIKVVEKGNILATRRQERERRKTQEISLLRHSPSDEFASQTLPRPAKDRERSKTAVVDNSSVLGSIPASSSTTVHVEDEIHKTPSFNTRRSNSMKRQTSKWEDMSAIDMRGFMDRKQDLQGGGKRATIRSWKNYYTILCGQLLCFFKDEAAFYENSASSPPIYILGASCEQNPEYVKKRNTFRLRTQDGSEYIFACPDERHMLEWVAKIKYHACLAPSNQLKSFSYQEQSTPTARGDEEVPPPVPMRRHLDTTSSSSSSHRDPIELDYSNNQRDKADTMSSTYSHRTRSSTGAGSNGTTETLMYQEHSTTSYERDGVRRSGRPGDSEFVAWVESNQPHEQSSPLSRPRYDDTDSLKSSSSKKKGFSLFKRGSKTSSK